MKWLLITIFFCATHLSYTQSLSDWSGNFEGSILGANATLIGTLKGDQWTGTISVSGYPIQFEGTVIDMECTGTMTDTQAKTSTSFIAKYAGKQINISISDINPISGLEENMNFVFFKTNSHQVVGDIISSSVTVVENAKDLQHDQSLIGLWRYTSTYVSGDFSAATDYFIQFNGNGILLTTDGRTAGGSATSSLDSGDGDIHQSDWKSENKTLWTRNGTGNWQSYAHYFIDGKSLMLIFDNGKKQVWERM